LAPPGYSTSRFSAPRYLALDGSDHASRHGRGGTIRRPIIWHPQSRSAPTATPLPGPGRRLTRHWPAVPRHARQAARRSSPERTAPAIASSRNVRTGKARQPGLPGLFGTPRRPRARTDHTSHSSPATCRSVAGSRPPQLHHSDCSPRHLLSRLGRSRGHRALPPGSELACGAGPIIAPGRRSAPAANSAAPGPGVPRGYHPRVPSLIQSGRSRARYRPGPQCAAPAIKDSAKHLQARPAARLKPRPPPVRASSSRHYAGDRRSDHCTPAA
jgi:hypothetical protein